MPYTVFALKWRPQSFDEIVGQKHVVATLKNAIQKKRLAHAYLFAGPRGVGKTSSARILAKALNCKDGPTLNPCGKCPACVDITAGRSFDVIEIDGASNRGIEEIRVLRENVKFPPVQGKFKIYIIDEVHQITTDGFNALLKTLEEPPPFVKFIFATTHPHKVIPTILSRCQRLDFRRIPAMEISAQLEQIAAAEKIDLDKEVLFAIAHASDGSLRDAESLLDQMASFSKEKISLKDVISVLGIVEQEALFELTDRLIRKDSRGALGLLNSIIDEGKDIGIFLSNLIEHFRNLMIAKIAQADAKLIDLPQEACEKLLLEANSFTLEEILAAFNILANTQEMGKRMETLRIPLEVALVKLSHDKKSTGHNPQPSHLPPPTQKKSADIAPPHNPPTAAHNSGIPAQTEEAINALPLGDIKNRWQEIIDAVAKVKMYAANYLGEGEPVKIEQNNLTIAFPKNYLLHKESLERKENRAIIENILSELFHTAIRVSFSLVKEVAQKQEGHQDSFVKSALDAFKARLIREG